MGLFDRFKKSPEQTVAKINLNELLVFSLADLNVQRAIAKKYSFEWQEFKDAVESRLLDLITTLDEKELVTIAKMQTFTKVAVKATENINNETFLEDIAKNAYWSNCKFKAIEKINNQDKLTNIAFTVVNKNDSTVTKKVIGKISNQESLKELYFRTNDSDLKKMILKRITDENILADIIINEEGYVPNEIFEKIDSPLILEKIAMAGKYQAVKGIYDQNILKNIVLSDCKNKMVIEDACKKIKITSYLTEIYNSTNDNDIKIICLSKLNDSNLILDFINSTSDESAISRAINLIKDENILHDLFEEGYGNMIHYSTVLDTITDNDFLVKIANQNKDCKISAIHKITSLEALEKVELPSEFEDRTYNGDGPVAHPVNDAYKKRRAELLK